jgi:hypothetical protein
MSELTVIEPPKKLRKRDVTLKNLEKKLSDVYCENAVAMLDETFTELRSIIKDEKSSALAKIRACELAFQATKIIKAKDALVQVNQQFVNKGNDSGLPLSGSKVRSYESILRELEGEKVIAASEQVIDV